MKKKKDHLLNIKMTLVDLSYYIGKGKMIYEKKPDNYYFCVKYNFVITFSCWVYT